MAFTLDQLTALDAAIAQGTLIVKYSDKEVTYRTLEEMMQIRALVQQDLGLISKVNPGRRYADYSSGLTNCNND